MDESVRVSLEMDGSRPAEREGVRSVLMCSYKQHVKSDIDKQQELLLHVHQLAASFSPVREKLKQSCRFCFSYLSVCCSATTTTPSCVVVTRVFAVVAGHVQVLEVEARRQVLHGHWRPMRVSIQQQQRLVVALDAAGNHVLPLGANLQGKKHICKL